MVQDPAEAEIVGTVTAEDTGGPLEGVFVLIEGTDLIVATDAAGRYRLVGVPPGPRTLRLQRIGYATARLPIDVRPGIVDRRDVALTVNALTMEDLRVTADAVSRAEGELGTATVIDEQAIANQAAASLQGVLELLPGVVLSPPGLDGVQQFSLRSVPTPGTSFGAGIGLTNGRSPADLASFGTSVILDGIPISNNSNLQTLGPRGELFIPSSAGGGIDLRQIPARTLDRVEVVRGVPSVRYGDLTQGAVIVYTKAGEVPPELSFQVDPRTNAGTGIGGTSLGGAQVGALTLDLTRTALSPGLGDDVGSRLRAQLSHRAGASTGFGTPSRLTLDTRLDLFQVLEDIPPTEDQPSGARRSRDRGLRLSERAELRLGGDSRLRFSGALSWNQQRSFSQASLVRSALPVTDRLTEGTQEGSFIVGEYLSRVDVEGDPWQIYARLEAESSARFAGLQHTLRPGLELRREWTDGPGIQFDITRPPQVRFNGARGFDRPRSWDDIPAVSSSALYLDDRMTATLFGGARLDIQAGVRLDLLHEGGSWASGVRDATFQPRVNAQLSPNSTIRFRLGAGLTAKLPSVADLYPAPDYYDLVNVNFFANDPAERLSVITTFIRDPTNPDVGFSRGEKLDAGIELSLGPGSGLSLTAFRDRIDGGVGIDFDPQFVERERFDVMDTPGDGIPPVVLEPPADVDTVPILLQRPANNLELVSRGFELTASLPEIDPIHTRFEVQGAWTESEFRRAGLDFGTADLWEQFQLDGDRTRSPFWEATEGHGERLVLTYRAIYHQPELGLVVTGIVQHFAMESQQTVAATDTLAFAGYITRSGELVEVAPERRADPEFADLRRTRTGFLTEPQKVPADWFLSLRVAKTLPLNGRLTFYVFNALDREGRRSGLGFQRRFFAPLRFGLEAQFPLQHVF